MTAYSASNPVPVTRLGARDGEVEALASVLRSGKLSGTSDVVECYETALAQFFRVDHVVACSSGSAALHLALEAVGAVDGAEVVVTALAPLPTLLPILTARAVPVFVDVAARGVGIDAADLSRVVSARTRAVIAVPVWGYPARSDDSVALLRDRGIPLIEDAAQAHGTRYADAWAGATAEIGCFSTHDHKLLATGEGGFLVAASAEHEARLRALRAFGQMDGVRWGANYKLAALLAGLGAVRLGNLDGEIAARQHIGAAYREAFRSVPDVSELEFAPGDRPNYYRFVLRVGEGYDRRELATALANAGLPPDQNTYGFCVGYQRPLFAALARKCPNAEAVVRDTVQLPAHSGLTEADVAYVIDRTRAAFANARLADASP